MLLGKVRPSNMSAKALSAGFQRTAQLRRSETMPTFNAESLAELLTVRPARRAEPLNRPTLASLASIGLAVVVPALVAR